MCRCCGWLQCPVFPTDGYLMDVCLNEALNKFTLLQNTKSCLRTMYVNLLQGQRHIGWILEDDSSRASLTVSLWYHAKPPGLAPPPLHAQPLLLQNNGTIWHSVWPLFLGWAFRMAMPTGSSAVHCLASRGTLWQGQVGTERSLFLGTFNIN